MEKKGLGSTSVSGGCGVYEVVLGSLGCRVSQSSEFVLRG